MLFDDRMEISDNSRIVQIFMLVTFMGSCLYAITCITGYDRANEPLVFYSGIIVLVLWGIAIPIMFTRTYQRNLRYIDINSIKINRNFAGDFIARIKLKKGKIRFLAMNGNQQEFDCFVQHLDEIRSFAIEKPDYF